MPDEKVIKTYYNLTIKEKSGYDASVTDQRIIFTKKREMHELDISQISSMSWMRENTIGFLIVGIVLVILGIICGIVFYNITGEGDISFGISSFFFLIGIVLILVWVFYKPEYMEIYSAGRKMKVSGNREALDDLVKITRIQQKRTKYPYPPPSHLYFRDQEKYQSKRTTKHVIPPTSHYNHLENDKNEIPAPTPEEHNEIPEPPSPEKEVLFMEEEERGDEDEEVVLEPLVEVKSVGEEKISMCPYCGKDLNFPEEVKFCPYCRKQILF